MYANELKKQLAPLAVKMQAIVDKAKAENNRGLTSEEREQYHRLEADFTALEDSIKIAEKSNNVVEDLAKPGKNFISEVQAEELQDTFRKPKKSVYGNSAYEKAFQNYVRSGERLAGNDRQALESMRIKNAQTLTTSGGGYLVPVGFSNMLEEAMKYYLVMDEWVGKMETPTGNPLNFPTVNDTTNQGRYIGVNTQVTETDITFGQVTFNAYIASSDIVLVPIALVEDSFFDIDALVARLLGIRLGRLKNTGCTTGSGSNQPTGIVTAATTAGNIYTMPSGNTTSITYAGLVNLEHSVDPAYRNNQKTAWMFSDTVLKNIKLLVDGNNRPLWQPGLTASFREGAGVDTIKPTILDHPYVINNVMATPAANAYTIAFGDFSKFVVRDVEGSNQLLVLKERYADYLQVGFIGFNRHDAQLLDAGTHPVALLQQSAS